MTPRPPFKDKDYHTITKRLGDMDLLDQEIARLEACGAPCDERKQRAQWTRQVYKAILQQYFDEYPQP